EEVHAEGEDGEPDQSDGHETQAFDLHQVAAIAGRLGRQYEAGDSEGGKGNGRPAGNLTHPDGDVDGCVLRDADGDLERAIRNGVGQRRIDDPQAVLHQWRGVVDLYQQPAPAPLYDRAVQLLYTCVKDA